MTQLQFAAQAYQARSSQLIDQRCINAFTEPSPKDAKTPAPVYGTAGLSLFSRMGNGPIRGMHVMAGNLYLISGTALYEITQDAVLQTLEGTAVPATLIGNTTLSNYISMADNAQQLVMVDGDIGWIYQPGGLNQVVTSTAYASAVAVTINLTGYITAGDPLLIALDDGTIFRTTATYNNPPTNTVLQFNDPLPSQVSAGAIIIDPNVTLAQITNEAFMPANVVRYFDGYFVFNATGTRQFFLSGINDGTQYSGLDFATASAGSTNIIAVEVYHEQLLLLCGDRIEIWWDAGNVAFPFQRYDAALIARGLAAPYATCSEDNTVFWLAEDGIMYRLNGFVPERISTFAMEYAWSQYPQKFLDATCFVITQEGHKFVVVTFPSGNQTWVYDIASKLWHQRESWGTPWV